MPTPRGVQAKRLAAGDRPHRDSVANGRPLEPSERVLTILLEVEVGGQKTFVVFQVRDLVGEGLLFAGGIVPRATRFYGEAGREGREGHEEHGS